jgi:hypothetical protein
MCITRTSHALQRLEMSASDVAPAVLRPSSLWQAGERGGSVSTRSESVATLRRFVDTRSAAGWGAVANALAAGLRQLLSEWALFAAQLEHRALCGALPLQVHPANCIDH